VGIKNDLKRLKEEYPETLMAAERFYAQEAGVTHTKWVEAMTSCIGGSLFGYFPIPLDEAKKIIKSVIDKEPPFEKKVAWEDKRGSVPIEFVEFYASPKTIRDAYFYELKQVCKL